MILLLLLLLLLSLTVVYEGGGLAYWYSLRLQADKPSWYITSDPGQNSRQFS